MRMRVGAFFLLGILIGAKVCRLTITPNSMRQSSQIRKGKGLESCSIEYQESKKPRDFTPPSGTNFWALNAIATRTRDSHWATSIVGRSPDLTNVEASSSSRNSPIAEWSSAKPIPSRRWMLSSMGGANTRAYRSLTEAPLKAARRWG